MDESQEKQITPDLVRRTTGGWLAVAPPGARFAIAVTGATADEVREKFWFTYARWTEMVGIRPKPPEAVPIPVE